MGNKYTIIVLTISVMAGLLFGTFIFHNNKDEVSIKSNHQYNYVEEDVTSDIDEEIETIPETTVEDIDYNITVINPTDTPIESTDGYTCWFVNFELQDEHKVIGGGTACVMIESTFLDFRKVELEITKERGGVTSIISFIKQIPYNTYREYNIAYNHPYK